MPAVLQTYSIGSGQIASIELWNPTDDAGTVTSIAVLSYIEGRTRPLVAGGIRAKTQTTSALSVAVGIGAVLTEDIVGRASVTGTLTTGIIKQFSGAVNGVTYIPSTSFDRLTANSIVGSSSVVSALTKETLDPMEWDSIYSIEFPASPTDGQVFNTTLLAESSAGNVGSVGTSWLYYRSIRDTSEWFGGGTPTGPTAPTAPTGPGEWYSRAATIIGAGSIVSREIVNRNVLLSATLLGKTAVMHRNVASSYIDAGMVQGNPTAPISPALYSAKEGIFFDLKTFTYSYDTYGEAEKSINGVSSFTAPTGPAAATGADGPVLNINYGLGAPDRGYLGAYEVNNLNVSYEIMGSSTVTSDLRESTNYSDGASSVEGTLQAVAHHALSGAVNGTNVVESLLRYVWEYDCVIGSAVIRQVEQPIITNGPSERYTGATSFPPPQIHFESNPDTLQYASDGSPLDIQQFRYEISAIEVYNDLPNLVGYSMGLTTFYPTGPTAPSYSPAPTGPTGARLNYNTARLSAVLNGRTKIGTSLLDPSGEPIVFTDGVNMGSSTSRYHENAADVFTICTSSTRPLSPGLGDSIYETDTLSYFMWNGAAWVSASPDATYLVTGPTGPIGGRYR